MPEAENGPQTWKLAETGSQHTTPLVAAAPASLSAVTSVGSGPTEISALPKIVNLTLYAGDDFNLPLVANGPDGQAADLTGATVRSQIRETAASEQVAGEFIPNIIMNVVVLHLAGATSGELPASSVYDAEIETTDGRTTTLVAGTITMKPQVTRPDAE